MDLTFWCLIFWVLASGRTFSLPSPENVTVDCDNFETFVYWNYSENSVDHLFEVQLKTDIGRGSVTFETNEHYRNITGLLNNTSYVIYTIKIRARTLTDTSSFSPPVRFAFDQIVKDDAIFMCKLNFPTVTIEYTYGSLTLSFQNPLRLYEDTPALKSLASNTYPKLKNFCLYYQVTHQNNITEEFSCPYERTTCEGNLHISDKKEQYCINLSGHIGDRAVVRADEFCSDLHQRDPPSVSGIVTLVSLMLITGAVVGLGAFVFHKKIFKPKQSLPSSLATDSTSSLQSGPSKKNRGNGACSRNSEMDNQRWTNITPSETASLLSGHISSCSCCSDSPLLLIGPDHAPREGHGWANQKNEELERVNESTDLKTLAGPPSSDYDARQGIHVEVILGVHGEEEETHSQGLAEGSDEVSEHLRDSSGCLSTSGYDSRHFIDSFNGEEESYDNGQQIGSDYEARHHSVEMIPGDCGDGYATGEALD